VPAALLWSTVYAGGGYVLASQWSTFELILRRVGWVGTVVAVVIIGSWYFWQRRVIRASVAAVIPPAATVARTPVGATASAAPAGSSNGKVVAAGPSGQPAEPVH
jgi:hypothetical protein